MSSEADKLWENLAPKVRKKQGFCPLTPEEATAAYRDAPEVKISEERIKEIVDSATSRGEGEWVPGQDGEWDGDEVPDEAAQGLYQIHRNEGEKTPETDKKEDDLKRKMLSDDDPEEDKT
jgi:hypothetical protein